ncbi:MAG: hypothetical protein U0354_14260 [Candidatus Sericytochromatia bacterium]
MTNLGIAGGVSLRNINQWISVIDTNLTNSKRIGYKETSVSMTTGEVGRYGTTQSIGKIQDITIPSASLEIGKTRILDSVQGNLTQTGQVTDFALNGTGYFVVEDKLGNRYATRDGQFNFDTDGYLVTAEGLRVLSTGFDYIRVPASENFAVNTEGESQYIATSNTIFDSRFNPTAGVSSFSQSVYGTKKLLVVDIVDDYKLIYSKYGYTKFDLGKRVPIVVRNDFSQYTDGIDTSLISDSLTAVPSIPLPAVPMRSFFKHDVQNGTMKMTVNHTDGTVRYVQAIYGGQKYMDFQTEMDFHIRSGESGGNLTGSFGSFGLTFGKATYDTQDNATNTFFAGIINNQFVLRRGGVNLVGSVNVTGPNLDDPFGALVAAKKFTIKLSVADGKISAQLLQNGANLATLTLANKSSYQGGYISVGNSIQDPNVGSGANNDEDEAFDITNITIVERNQDSNFSQNIVQKNVKDIWKDGSNAQIKETQVLQQNLEESTSTIADTLPLLSNTQKLFSAVSKIISVYNSITDDMNNTVR